MKYLNINMACHLFGLIVVIVFCVDYSFCNALEISQQTVNEGKSYAVLAEISKFWLIWLLREMFWKYYKTFTLFWFFCNSRCPRGHDRSFLVALYWFVNKTCSDLQFELSQSAKGYFESPYHFYFLLSCHSLSFISEKNGSFNVLKALQCCVWV